VGNPICTFDPTKNYCAVSQSNTPTYFTPPNNCVPAHCSLAQVSSPNCICAYPYSGTLVFRAPSFSDLGNLSYYIDLRANLTNTFQSQKLPVDSVSLSNPYKDSSEQLEISLQVFPSGQDRFNETGISLIAFVLSNQIFKPPDFFGPFYFRANAPYEFYTGNFEFTFQIKCSTCSIFFVLLRCISKKTKLSQC
jgi:hypothetical protein